MPTFDALWTDWRIGVLIYAVVQLLAVVTLRGKHRLLVMAPAAMVMAAGAHAMYAYHHDSNLWPIVLIFTSPAATVAVAVIWVGALLQRRRSVGT